MRALTEDNYKFRRETAVFVPFKVSQFSNLTFYDVLVYNIDNSNLFSVIDSGLFSFVTIINSHFFKSNKNFHTK